MSSRHALAPARSVDDHRQRIEELLRPLAARDTERVAMTAALGRRLAEDVYSPLDLPVFRNSSMDGYAVRADSIATVPVTLPLAGVVAAGNTGELTLPDGAALKVMTGAPIPAGADCVVPVEHTSSDGGTVTIETTRAAGDFVREPGTDVRTGELLAAAGTLLQPRHIAALAAVGLADLPVTRPVRAAVLTTGDELMPAGTPLLPGQIYNSNGIALAAALTDNGVEVVSLAHSTDDHDEFRQRIEEATALADVVFTSGGVSKGDFEVVKDVLTPLGGEFGSVAIQPGGPQGLTVVHGVPILSFPGNPVSTMVSFEVFARPILRALAALPELATTEVPLLDPVRSPAGKNQFLRGKLTDTGVSLVAGPGSHLIATMAHADVLIDIPADITELAAGTPVRILPL
ncbi:gephyrin-like molybdotransferase Glp [Nocardia huaxiensis]|uniref:Molybdopterin molybdenumtransferase n=1 Tax=Nocardia huaxiensis TaxID=2755382 RepID=A0A7D6ZHW0_9NOCA|nr:gephyrin-like molybdotransferase Glp [Nocardia huaxiensis]QLY30120.1 molybdopterin molybdotransferase MoeA [Nocardia huaxiensis]UFS96269.1 molybdopterin molybdotransferase MoeA [Nocardia huaxiensis]